MAELVGDGRHSIRASSIATKRRSFWVKHWLCCRTMVM
jgi:hypothetical protein